MGRLTDFGSFTSDENADIGIRRNSGGVSVVDGRWPGHWAQITGGSNPYSHVSVAPGPAGSNVPMPAEVPFEFGNPDSWPAYEQNGSTSVAVGTIVWLEPEGYTLGYRFIKPPAGSGSGAGSGASSVGGCCPNESRVVDVRCVGNDLMAFVVTNDSSGTPGPQVPEMICAGICSSCTPAPTGSCTVPLPCPPDVCIPVANTSTGATSTNVTLTKVGGTVWTGGTNPAGTITIATGRGVFTYPSGDQVYVFPNAGYQPQETGFSLTYPRQIYAPAGGLPTTTIDGTVTATKGSCTPPTCITVNPDSLPGTLNFVISGVTSPCAVNATWLATASGAGLSRTWTSGAPNPAIPASSDGIACDTNNAISLKCNGGVYQLHAATTFGGGCDGSDVSAASGESSPFLLVFHVPNCWFSAGPGTVTVTVSV